MTRQLRPGQLRTGSLYDISSSFALTSSYSLSGTGFPYSGSAIITGSLLVSGSGITGSLQGTSSFAITASYVSSLGSSNHTQSFSNSNTWTFNHGLGTRFVIIQTYDSGYDEMIPQNIDLTDDNTVTITFPTLESGYAVASVGGALSTGNVYNTYTSSINTSSFATTGSNTFNGNQTITGSFIITGSSQGNVTALSISSNTASLNLTAGSFFTLQLVSGSNTYINPSNIKPGITATLLLSTTGSATVSFPSTIKTGSAYVPTTTVSKDILTFVSFDATNLYLAAVKNLG